MPFIRFARDKRGYETTSLLHSFRKQGRSQPTLIYYFRTPVGTKVGRTPLDEDAIRLIEDKHPDVVFDWQKMLQIAPADESEKTEAQPQGQPSESKSRKRRRKRERADSLQAPSAAADSLGEEEASDPEQPQEYEREAVADDFRPTHERIAAEEKFSPADLARLRGRHAVILARIDQQILDPDRVQQLRAVAEALNPDTWTTHEEVAEALENYERVYRQLQEALIRARRTDEAVVDAEQTPESEEGE